MTLKAITSKDNPVFKRLRSALKENSGYKSDNHLWIEGENLCESAIEKGLHFKEIILLDTVVERELDFWSKSAAQVYTMPQNLLNALSQLPSATWVLGSLVISDAHAIDPSGPIVVLDEVQDPGNAGSIIRCAAAFGFRQIVTTPGSVSLWSPKVVRAGMGAHFSLQLIESVEIDQLIHLSIPILLTDSHHGEFLHELSRQQLLPTACLWVFGHEGRGVSQNWQAENIHWVRITQPGGQESLNVAAAAAICLHAYSSQRIEKF